ncbi:hypothetical protein [Pedobacter sp. KLB.chiD]|uniref:hypothetical protein n=1 Tax=Pedobacter sp. KLB.chiD TaxID=3387402 RepID=UPI00399AAFF2
MKKLSLKPTAFAKGEVLTKAQMKKVVGGSCGVKINGNWYSVSGGRSEAEGSLGRSGTWNNGQVSGTVTNWCCDSCYWN